MPSDGSLGPDVASEQDAAPDAALAQGLDVSALLQGWRERGDDRLDPVGFHVIEALARRAAEHDGAVRQRLDERLAQLVQAYADRVAGDKPAADAAGVAQAAANAQIDAIAAADTGHSCAAVRPTAVRPAAPAPRPRGPLAELAAFLAYPGEAGDDPDAAAAQARRDAYPDLPALDYFREVWSGLSADRQVRQSQEQVHKNAGPLNSNQLVHRALTLMRELSPGYLQQFVAYTETLTWMEQVTAAATPPAKDAPRAGAAKKSSRAKAR